MQKSSSSLGLYEEMQCKRKEKHKEHTISVNSEDIYISPIVFI